jgi:ABC-2 type transport system permease protein
VRLYIEVARREFQRHLAYRTATLAGLFTNSIFGLLFSAVYIALYRDAGADREVAGFNVAEALTYVWITQSLIMVVAVWGTWDIALGVRSGDIYADLFKPFDYFLYWLSRDLGRAACYTMTRFVPTLIFGAALFDLALPPDAMTWLGFAAAITLAVLVSFPLRFMLNLSAFWLTDIQGVRTLQLSLISFLSGFLVPISFFPSSLRTVAEWLPFRAMMMLPVNVLLDQQSVSAALTFQTMWALILTLGALAMLRLAMRKVVIQGG